jgi:hypothetical protein
MKNLAIALLLAGALCFAGLYVHQNHKVTELQSTLSTLQTNLDEAQARLESQQQKSTSLQTHLRDTQAKAIAKADEVTQLQQVLTNRVGTNGGNPLAEMFKSPAMRQMVRTSQKTALSGMVDKNYAAFFSQMNMTPEQAASLKDLILKKSMVDAETGLSLMSGDSDATKRADALQQAKTDKAAIDEQIKEFLGEENFSAFQAYEKSVPERMTISMFKDQQGTGGVALSPDQEQQLVQALAEERQSFEFTTDYSDQSKFAGDFAANFSEDKLSQYRQESEQLDQKYIARAQNILPQDQLGPFEQFLAGRRDMQIAGLKLAAKMFGH